VTPTKDAPPRDGAEHDAALMARAKRGDVGAFAAVYDRHAPGVLSLLSRVLRDASEAHDLLHDVFLEAWLSASDYDERRASVRVWLLVRARSRALDRRARQGRQQQLHDAFAQSETAAAQDGSTPPAERALAVQEALATLDKSVRQALELRYFDGLAVSEIASHMGIPEGTVKSRLARGLEIMQRVLRPNEEESP
jgi:RNA polymerase sigma-70 factor (ECF subfamily)